MSHDRLMGGETEYALAARDADGHPVGQHELVNGLMAFARRTLDCSSVAPCNRFLGNGCLLCVDPTAHLEWSSAECISPHDAVRYLRAGDLIVQRLVDAFARARGFASTFCSRCNVDYLSSTSWASHESYAHRGNPGLLPEQLVPFLASRVVYAGAGGWDPLLPGLRFTLAPRARFTEETVGLDSQCLRPIFHLKHESLSTTGTHRLHVLCGESLCSDVASLLRFGATALVVAIVEAGDTPGAGLAMCAPVDAYRTMAGDASCRAPVRLRDGRACTAIELQRCYLEAVERRLDDGWLPAWAGQVCALWRQTLNDLETDSPRVATSLDWAIKRGVFERLLRRLGIEWAALDAWNTLLERARMMEVPGLYEALTPGDTRANHAPLDPGAIETLAPVARQEGLDIRGLPAFLAARRAAFEIDMRFGELGNAGVFTALDRAGVLTHTVEGIDNVEAATEQPPRGTRATLRGDVVRRLSEARTRYRAEWTRIVDLDGSRVLDLGDPFETVERWIPLPIESAVASGEGP